MKKKSSRSIILPVLLALFLLIISWYMIAPAYKEAKAEKVNLEYEVMTLQEKLSWLEDADSSLTSSEAVFDKLFVSVPSDGKDEPNAIAELEAIALKHDLVIPSISFSDSIEDMEYDENLTQLPSSRISISVVLTGNFESLSSFINDVEKSVKFMNVKSFTFSDDGTDIGLSLEIEAFSQQKSDQDLESFQYEEGI